MTYRYRLGFTDVDFARLVFSGEYYRWAERAFEAWQMESGLPWRRMLEELELGLPSVETRCHYVAPLGFEDELDVAIGVRDLDDRGFVSDFTITRVHDGMLAAHGYLVRRFVDIRTMRTSRRVPEQALAVFRAMAEQGGVEHYDERVARLDRERGERRSGAAPAVP